MAQLTSVHLVSKEVILTWPLAKSKSLDTDTSLHGGLWPWCSLLSAPISGLPSSSSELLTDAEEIIRKVTTMDISEIMLTQYQIQSIMWVGAGRVVHLTATSLKSLRLRKLLDLSALAY